MKGWQCLSFSEAVADVTGGNVKLQRKDYSTSGRIPIIDQGADDVAGYTDQEDAAYSGELPVVLFGDHTRHIKFADQAFVLGADGVKVLRPRGDLDARFLYYSLRRTPIPSKGYSRHFKYLRERNISFPSPDEQHRLVAILDEADALCRRRREADEIATGLLTRSFADVLREPGAVLSTQRLDAIAQISGGGTPSKAQPDFWTGDIPWISPKDMKTPRLHDTEDHISEAAVRGSSTSQIPAGTTVIVVRSGILAHTVPVAITARPMTINQDIKAVCAKSGILPHYLFGFLRAHSEQLLGCVKRGATVHNFEMASFKAFPVPVAADSVQQRLAELTTEWLDNLERSQTTAATLDTLFQTLLERAFDGRLSADHRTGAVRETVQEMAMQSLARN